MADTLLDRLLALEERMERIERISYLCYTEIRKVAEYAYLNVRLEADADSVKRIPKMRNLNDQEALRSGMDFDDLVALKFKQRYLVARCRKDVLEIAKEIADERLRRPIAMEEERSVA